MALTRKQTAPRLPSEGHRDRGFWKRHPGIVWSNPDASDEVMIANALLRQPEFSLILEISLRFGIERVQRVWETLVEEDPERSETRKAAPYVERILKNITEGMRRCSLHPG